MVNVANRKCRWRVRDLPTWRAGTLFSASADLLVVWHNAAVTGDAPGWTATKRRFGAAVERVRRARLDRELDRLDRACRDVIAIARRGGPTAAPVRVAVAALEDAVAVAADPFPCLLGCAACASAARRPSVRDSGGAAAEPGGGRG